MSDDVEVKFTSEEEQLRVWEFRSALSTCEDQNEFVTCYIEALTEKFEQMKPLYERAGASSTVIAGWQCAAFLIACGQKNLPIKDAVQTLREFVQFLDDGLVHWR